MSNASEIVKPRRRMEAPAAPAASPTSATSAPPASMVASPSLKIANPDQAPTLLAASQLFKTYRKGKHEVPVLKGCDFSAQAGKITAILGQSGSGKSTLLHLLGTLDAPDSGEITFENRRIDNLPRRQRDTFRNATLGMIFQFYHLLPELSAFHNVLLPMMIQQGFFGYLQNRLSIRQRARDLLVRVGLEHRMHHKPRELSGGEMQRAAIARALIAEPELLLADEPTGNLDQETGAQILHLLQELNREHGLTIVMVTHDIKIADACDAVIRLADGRISS